jgi:thymidylate kinase
LRAKSSKIIVLSGIDGSGKTIQSRIQYVKLTERGFKIMLCHYELFSLLQKLSALVVAHIKRNQAKPEDRLATRIISRKYADLKKLQVFNLKACLWLLVYFFNDLLLSIKLRLYMLTSYVILADRYPLIDGLVMLQYKGINYRALLKLYSRFIPRPNVCIFIDTPVGITLLRRPEHTLFRQLVQRILFINVLKELIARGTVEIVQVVDGTLSIGQLAAVIDSILSSIIDGIDKT